MRLTLTTGRLFAGAAAAVLLTLAPSCNVSPSGTQPMLFNHCGDLAGDATCVSIPGKPYCDLCRSATEDQGCAASPPAVPACRPDPGLSGTGDASMDPDDDGSSTTTGEDSTTTELGTSSGSTTGTVLSCESESGTFDETCSEADPAAAYCVDEACVGCEDAGGHEFCAGLDALAPACDNASQLCVGCGDAEEFACPEDSPVCTADGDCVPCQGHADCPDTACHLDPSDPLYGQCFAEDERIWVDHGASCPGNGSEASPACSLATVFDGMQDDQNWVLIVEGGTDYDETPILTADATIALLGQSTPVLVGESGLENPLLDIQAGTVYAADIEVSGSVEGHGVSCQDAVLWLQDSVVEGNIDYGVYVESPCTVVLHRSNIYGNEGGGVRQFGGPLVIDNSAIGHNGDGARGPGINLQFADLQVIYGTVAGNDATGEDNLQCLDATGTVRNSIFVGVDSGSVALDCFTLEFDRNAVDTVGFSGAEGTLVAEDYNPLWFDNPDAGDFQLAAPPLTPFGDVAVWEDGDPLLDADGTERPQGGAEAYAGVDEPD